MIKRLKGFILIPFMLTFLASTSVFASEQSGKHEEPVIGEFHTLDSIEGIDLESHMVESERLVQIGEQISRERVTYVLSGFKNLQQGDSRWKNEIMQTCGSSIGTAGCCLTSFTMIQRYLGGTDDPAQVNAKMGNDACPFVYKTAATLYDFDYNYASDASKKRYVDYIKGAINVGAPVLVGMEKGGGTHFVAAYGYDDNEIIISDPASRNYTLLSQYTDNGYTVNRLISYGK